MQQWVLKSFVIKRFILYRFPARKCLLQHCSTCWLLKYNRQTLNNVPRWGHLPLTYALHFGDLQISVAFRPMLSFLTMRLTAWNQEEVDHFNSLQYINETRFSSLTFIALMQYNYKCCHICNNMLRTQKNFALCVCVQDHRQSEFTCTHMWCSSLDSRVEWQNKLLLGTFPWIKREKLDWYYSNRNETPKNVSPRGTGRTAQVL